MKSPGRGRRHAGAFVALIVVALGACRRAPAPQPRETLRIGFLQDPLAALLFIADESGSFSRHGLEISTRAYEGGAYAIRDLEAGTLDVAAATEYALVRRSFSNTTLRTIAAIATANNVEILVRSDRGIVRAADLRHRRIGVSAGMNTRYILGTFLALNGLRLDDVTIAPLTPSQIVAGLTDGTIDAGCIYPPFTETAKSGLGQGLVTWPAQVHQDYFYLLVAREQWIQANPGLVESLLRSLLEAESFLKARPTEAGRIVAEAVSLPPGEIRERLSSVRPHVSLDEDMLTLMEDEARWILSQPLEGEGELPNVFTLVHYQSLERLKPTAVGIIH